MAELADALDLGSNAQKACRFKSCSRHHSPNPSEELLVRSRLRALRLSLLRSPDSIPQTNYPTCHFF
jgi:hypothetical protein